jgi:hypothetical protein
MSDNSKKLLAEQLINNEKINKLLELASDYINCDKNCQKNKTTKKLYNKYIDSQTNLKMAPERLERNRKNYFIHTHGQEYYDDMMKNEANEKIKIISDELKKNFYEQLSLAKSMGELLNTTYSSSQIALSSLSDYEKLKLKLLNDIENNTNDVLVNDRTVYYDNESIDRLKLYNKLFNFLYYFGIIIFMILKIPKNKSDLISYGIIVGILFLYPVLAFSGSDFFYNNGLIIIFYIMSIMFVFSLIFFILFLLSKTFKYTLISLYTVILKIYNYLGK